MSTKKKLSPMFITALIGLVALWRLSALAGGMIPPTPGVDVPPLGPDLKVPSRYLPVGVSVPQRLSNMTTVAVNVKDFGAKGDGSHDDTAAIQSAINALPRNGETPGRGGRVMLPPGVFNYTSINLSAANPHVKLDGAGRDATTLNYVGHGGISCSIRTHRCSINNLTMQDVTSGGPSTAIDIVGTENTIENVRIIGLDNNTGWYNGIKIHGTASPFNESFRNRINNVDIVNAHGDGISTAYTIDTYITNSIINGYQDNTTSIGLRIDTESSGLYASGLTVGYGRNALVFDNSNPLGTGVSHNAPSFLFFDKFIGDTTTGGDVIWFAPGLGTANIYAEFKNSWAAYGGHKQDGTSVTPANGILIEGGRNISWQGIVRANTRNGVLVDNSNVSNFQVHDSFIGGNNTDNYADAHGIYISADNSFTQIIGNRIGNTLEGSGHQKYGISLGASNINELAVSGNILNDNDNGTLLDNRTSGGDAIITGNVPDSVNAIDRRKWAFLPDDQHFTGRNNFDHAYGNFSGAFYGTLVGTGGRSNPFAGISSVVGGTRTALSGTSALGTGVSGSGHTGVSGTGSGLGYGGFFAGGQGLYGSTVVSGDGKFNGSSVSTLDSSNNVVQPVQRAATMYPVPLSNRTTTIFSLHGMKTAFNKLIGKRMWNQANTTHVYFGDSVSFGDGLTHPTQQCWPRRCFERERYIFNNTSSTWKYYHAANTGGPFGVFSTAVYPASVTQKVVHREYNISKGATCLINWTSATNFANLFTGISTTSMGQPVHMAVTIAHGFNNNPYESVNQRLTEYKSFANKLRAAFPGMDGLGPEINFIIEPGVVPPTNWKPPLYYREAVAVAAKALCGGLVDFANALITYNPTYNNNSLLHPDAATADFLGYVYSRACVPYGAEPAITSQIFQDVIATPIETTRNIYINPSASSVTMNGQTWGAGSDNDTDGTFAGGLWQPGVGTLTHPYKTWAAAKAGLPPLMRNHVNVFFAPVACHEQVHTGGITPIGSWNLNLFATYTTYDSGRASYTRNTFGLGTTIMQQYAKPVKFTSNQHNNRFLMMSTAQGKKSDGSYEMLPIYKTYSTSVWVAGRWKSTPAQNAPYWIKESRTTINADSTRTNNLTLDGKNHHAYGFKLAGTTGTATELIVNPGTTGSAENLTFVEDNASARAFYLDAPGGIVLSGNTYSGTTFSYFSASAGGNRDLTNNDINNTVYETATGDNDTLVGISGNHWDGQSQAKVGYRPGKTANTNNFANNLLENYSWGVFQEHGAVIRYASGNKFTGDNVGLQANSGSIAAYGSSPGTIWSATGQTGVKITNGAVVDDGVTLGSYNFTFLNSGGVNVSRPPIINTVTLTPASTITLDPTTGNIFNLTATSATTVNMSTITACPTGTDIDVIVYYHASEVITFGTGFKPNGTLSTTVSSSHSIVRFRFDGTNWNECFRTMNIPN